MLVIEKQAELKTLKDVLESRQGARIQLNVQIERKENTADIFAQKCEFLEKKFNEIHAHLTGATEIELEMGDRMEKVFHLICK